MIIGFDTSCYTTSLALTDGVKLIYERRFLLQVKPGTRGLRQSEAVFQHVQNLPHLMAELPPDIMITGVAVSDMPRPAAGSYLPVFKVGSSFGESIAKLLRVPLVKTSHQEGHLRAALFDYPHLTLPGQEFLTWHISGGTTDLLKVVSGTSGFEIVKIGGTSDLQVGQFIDRIGVLLGTSFPAGPHLEDLASQSAATVQKLPVVTRDLTVSFSGPASAAERLAGKSNPADLARQVFDCVGMSLLKVTEEAVKTWGIDHVLLVGGVASNQIIRGFLTAAGATAGIRFIFGSPGLSTDNAVGTSLIGYDFLERGKNQ